MKKPVLLILIVLMSFALYAQYTRGTVYEGPTIDSKILGKTVKYTTFLPTTTAASTSI